MKRKELIDIFSALGTALSDSYRNDSLHGAVVQACEANGWFTVESCRYAIEAVREQMLQPEKLEEFMSAYPLLPSAEQHNVGVVMAGNLPLVGFFDLLCVVLSGNCCRYRPSSKDSVLIDYLVGLLHHISPCLPIERLDNNAPLDAVIATGGESANMAFEARWKGVLPTLLRSSRTSVAVLDGSEDDRQLGLLSEDMFVHNGLGCRNVSIVMIPSGYQIERLVKAVEQYLLNPRVAMSPKYRHNYLHTKACLSLSDIDYIDCGGCVAVDYNSEAEPHLSQLRLFTYDNMEQVEQFMALHADFLQCTVGGDSVGLDCVPFGLAQRPALFDYPDGKDTMLFLQNL